MKHSINKKIIRNKRFYEQLYVYLIFIIFIIMTITEKVITVDSSSTEIYLSEQWYFDSFRFLLCSVIIFGHLVSKSNNYF